MKNHKHIGIKTFLLLIVIIISITASCQSKSTNITTNTDVSMPCCDDTNDVTEDNITESTINTNKIIFKGCSIIRRAFMSAAATKYQEDTGTEVLVIGGGATLGIRSTAAKDADIGGSCRPALPDMFDQEKGVKMVHVGWDALVFITNTSNPVDNITLNQAKKVLTGKITNWKEIGGTDNKIVPIFRSQVPEHGGKVSGVGYMTRVMLFNDHDFDYTDKALFFKHSSQVEKYTEEMDNSSAVTGYSSAQKRKVKILNVNGFKPTKENISTGNYKLFRPLFLIIKDKPEPKVKKFIDWILSDEGQKVISDEGTVNLIEGKKLYKKFKNWESKDLIINLPEDLNN